PTFQLSLVSGCSDAVPVTNTGSWSLACTYVPLAGTPFAMQLFCTLIGFGSRLLHGSMMVASKREPPPNNSPIDGARKPWPHEPRNSSSSIGRQRSPPEKVVSVPKVE